MVKKRVKKKVSKKSSVKKENKKPSRKKISLVWKNLVLFGILFLASFMLYIVTSNELLNDFFYLLSIVLGAITGAFILILLVFFVMKLMRK